MNIQMNPNLRSNPKSELLEFLSNLRLQTLLLMISKQPKQLQPQHNVKRFLEPLHLIQLHPRKPFNLNLKLTWISQAQTIRRRMWMKQICSRPMVPTSTRFLPKNSPSFAHTQLKMREFSQPLTSLLSTQLPCFWKEITWQSLALIMKTTTIVSPLITSLPGCPIIQDLASTIEISTPTSGSTM